MERGVVRLSVPAQHVVQVKSVEVAFGVLNRLEKVVLVDDIVTSFVIAVLLSFFVMMLH